MSNAAPQMSRKRMRAGKGVPARTTVYIAAQHEIPRAAL